MNVSFLLVIATVIVALFIYFVLTKFFAVPVNGKFILNFLENNQKSSTECLATKD